MLYRFRVLNTFSATTIICQPSCCFSWSCHRLLQHCLNRCRFSRVGILGQPHVAFLFLPSIQFTRLVFCSVLLYPLVFTPFSIFSFNLFHAGFHPQLIISPSILMLPSSNWISTPTSSIVLIASSTIEFSSLVFSLLHAEPIHLFFWGDHTASDCQPCLFADVFQRFHSSFTFFSSKVQSVMLYCFPSVFFYLNSCFFNLVQLLQFSTSKLTNVHWIGCYWYHFCADCTHQIHIIQFDVGQYLNLLLVLIPSAFFQGPSF